MWWDGVLAFAGGLLGAGVTFAAARYQTRAEQEARRREEWGRRFNAALERMSSADRRARAIGRVLAEELLTSELATEQDRREASRILDVTAIGAPGDLRSLPPSGLADLRVLRETRSSTERERGRDE